MKSLTQLLLMGAAVAALDLPAPAAPAVGQLAPDFAVTDINGQSHRLSDYQGQLVVLEWVNPECPFVRKHYEGSDNMPGTQQAARAAGAVWLSINSGNPGGQGDFSPEEVAAWSRRTGARPSAYIRDQDGRVGQLYDARHTPTLFIVDPAGILVYAGGIDDIVSAKATDVAQARNHVKAAFADLAAGRPVAQPITRAYGCSIKYAQ